MIKYDIPLYIAVAKSSRAAKWKNTRTTWAEVAESLRETARTAETVKQYFSYTKDKQDEIKDVGGFVGGKLLGGVSKIKGQDVEFKAPYGWRRKGFIEHRQLVALDVDYGDLDVWLDFKLFEYAGLFYTTHKHQRNDPRFRVVFPLDRPVSPDEYEAIARVVASWLGIDVFDDTTYQPTRLMYYPSTPKDGEYLYDFVDAPIMSADTVLNELEDWRDPTTWPTSSRERETQTPHAGDKVEDPEQKTGVVGAFCRAYGIDEAIAEFLEDVYEPCEALGPDRYSFIGGSTSGGLIVYDGKLAYSHHATDPAGGKLCNAFDLVRLHKFGDLDEKAKEGTDVTKLPSFKAMAEFAGTLKEVKKEIVRERRDVNDYDELEEDARERASMDDWVDQLELEKKGGQIKNTIHNVVIILQNDDNLKGAFGFNEFEQRETATRALPWDKKGTKYPRPLSDSDDAELRLYFERCYNITAKGQITDGLTVVIRTNSYHPVRDYLDAVTWDGEPRLDNLLVNLFGADDTDYVRAVTRKGFTAAVARIYSPGCKYDQVLVIIGEQGTGKSTLFNRMGGDWFSDSVTTLTGKEALESIQGAWIIELGELSGLRKAEVDAVKHFVSKREDRYRVAYGKRIEHFPRRCAFFGTTNEDDPLRDATGNRRFWIVNCKGRTGDLAVWDYITPGVRAQLWAEAKYYYQQGETLYLDSELETVARDIQDKHLERDDRTGLVREYLARRLPMDWDALEPYDRRFWLADKKNEGTVERRSVCLLEIWTECLGKNAEDIKRVDSFELSRLMRSLRDWEPSNAVRVPWYGLQKQYRNTAIKDPRAEGYLERKPKRKAKRKF